MSSWTLAHRAWSPHLVSLSLLTSLSLQQLITHNLLPMMGIPRRNRTASQPLERSVPYSLLLFFSLLCPPLPSTYTSARSLSCAALSVLQRQLAMPAELSCPRLFWLCCTQCYMRIVAAHSDVTSPGSRDRFTSRLAICAEPIPLHNEPPPILSIRPRDRALRFPRAFLLHPWPHCAPYVPISCFGRK